MAYEELLNVFFALLIVFAGYIIMRIISRIFFKIKSNYRASDINGKPMIFEKGFFIIVLIVALGFLGFESFKDFGISILEMIPEILRLVLLIILGVMMIQIICALIQKMLEFSGLEKAIVQEVDHNFIPLIYIIIKVILYIILIKIIITLIDIPILGKVSDFILYPMLALGFLIIFVALINPVRDFSSSFYLRKMWSFKPGNVVRIDNKVFTIKKITWLFTEMEGKGADYAVFPNRILVSKGIEFEKPSKELDTLDKLKQYYVAQLPSHCGPASAQIALSIFRIHSSQEELAKLAVTIQRKTPDQVAGTHPKNLISSVERITERKVRGVWISFDKIYDLKEEINLWLKDGALVIIDYKKRYLFPSAETAHYSLVVGAQNDEFLVIDPSSKTGGVYFVDYRDVFVGMDTYSKLIKGKRGYIVLAPHGSAAYQRIREGLIYHHPSMYDKISKSFEMRLNRITSSTAFRDMLPGFVKKSLNDLEKDQIYRVWKPEKKE